MNLVILGVIKMNLLDVVSQCNDPVMIHILGLCKRVLSVIQLVGPIIAMVALILNLIKLVTNPEDKKYKKALINWGIAFVMFFLIPVFINVVMGLFSSFKIGNCWANAMIIFYIYTSFGCFFVDFFLI